MDEEVQRLLFLCVSTYHAVHLHSLTERNTSGWCYSNHAFSLWMPINGTQGLVLGV